MASTAIGLDIGTSGVRAAELSFGKGRVTLEKFGQVALPEGAVRDGEVVDGPASTPQPTVETKVADGRVLARVVGPPL